ncbi:hypothetical protein K443DRAFT_101855, partial [Laccaria amethystina LaAM-08-1]
EPSITTFWRYLACCVSGGGFKRARRDKRLANFCSGDILDFLFGGQVVYVSQFSTVSRPKEMRGARSCVPEIFHIFCFDSHLFLFLSLIS